MLEGIEGKTEGRLEFAGALSESLGKKIGGRDVGDNDIAVHQSL
jgi:hypothetical protein